MISGGSPICRHWYVSHNPWGGCPLNGEYLRISRALLCLLSKIFCCHRISEGAIIDSCSRSATLSDRSCKDSFRPSPPPPRQRNCSPHGTSIPEKSRAKPFCWNSREKRGSIPRVVELQAATIRRGEVPTVATLYILYAR